MIAMRRIRGRSIVTLLCVGLVQACSDTAAPPVPAALAASASPPQSATVGTRVSAAVIVTDDSGRPVSGVPVTFEVTGGGSVAIATAQTSTNGAASPGEWTLGTATGTNTLRARAGSLPVVTFTVEGLPDVPAGIAVIDGDSAAGTAGQPLGQVPTVKVADQYGNAVAGQQVTFEPVLGSGSVTGGTQTTDANGIASPDSWQLGTGVGQQRLTVRAGTVSRTVTATAAAGAPAAIRPAQGGTLTGTVGSALSSAPGVLVTDAFNNLVAGATVQFTVQSGGGSVTGATQTTDAKGEARVGAWTLGTTAGEHVLQATVGSNLALTITATATAAEPAVVTAVSGDGQTGAPNGVLPLPATVRVSDQYGNAVSGATVAFTMVAGGGAVANPTSATAADGTASSGDWVLGSEPGVNTLQASVGILEPVTFNATGVGEAEQEFVLSKFAGDATTCPVATTDCRFTVLVSRATGLPAQGLTVTWTGAGGVTQQTTTNVHGRATSPNLVAGTVTGGATLTARLDATGDEVVFGYRHVQAGGFNIEMRFIGTATASQKAAFNAAAERWEQVITGDLSNITFTAGDSATAGICGVDHPAIIETIDDLVIYVQVEPIDGPGKILGQAGPCYTRLSNNLPIVGMMQLDDADLSGMESNGTLPDVLLHEIGHVLGIGTLWTAKGLLVGRGGDDPYFSGTRATSGFILGGGTLLNGVPVENSGGAGTRDGHWRESMFSTELMTGYISSSTNPLSVMTIGSLMDLGYEVNHGAADTYAIPGTTFGLREPEPFMALIELRELPAPAPRTIDDRR